MITPGIRRRSPRVTDRNDQTNRTDRRSSTFRELIVRPPAAASLSPSAGAAFEIVLGSGVVVRVPESFDAAGLERLLEVLARAHAC